MWPSMKIPNDAQIQDGRHIIFKNMFTSTYIKKNKLANLYFLLILAYCPSFKNIFFSQKFKMAEKLNMADFLQKNMIFW
jgi:hypothetical protein